MGMGNQLAGKKVSGTNSASYDDVGKVKTIKATDVRRNPENIYSDSSETDIGLFLDILHEKDLWNSLHQEPGDRKSLEPEEEYVLNLSKELKESGEQLEPGIVYKDTALSDGKSYTLLSGERRLKAILYNLKFNNGDNAFEAKIVGKPLNLNDERTILIKSNGIREKTKTVRLKEIEILSDIYDQKQKQKAENGDRTALGKKGEWISSFIGLSPRQIQNYLTEIKEIKEGKESEAKKQRKELQKSLRKLSTDTSNSTGCKISFKPNYTIVITPDQKNLDGLMELINKMGWKINDDENN